jgi:enolase
MKIKNIIAREILDSRGDPTLEVKVFLENGMCGVGFVPSGASTGKHEALELRDDDLKRYRGKGVMRACENVNTKIAPALLGKDVLDQGKIDKLLIELDGTKNKSKLGANAILGVSLACLSSASKSQKLEPYEYIAKIFGLGSETEFQIQGMPAFKKKKKFHLPFAFMNIINGGKHADSRLDIQEYMIVPKARTFFERVRQGSEVFHALKEILKQGGYATTVGDEGGFAPRLETNVQALDLIMQAIDKAGYKPGDDVVLAIDAAASEFYNEKDELYFLSLQKSSLTSDQLIALYREWVEKYPIVSLEDPLSEDDWAGWKKLTKKLGDKIQIVGDDLFVTNVKRLTLGVEQKLANAILIKPNQIGTVTETLDCIKEARKVGFKTMISHRSGETCDTFIADLSVGVNAGQIKTGSLSRGERVAKYNRLMEIENRISEE